MKRRLVNVLAGVSLMLCVITCAFWVRSYSIAEDFEWSTTTAVRRVRSSQGEVAFEKSSADWSGMPAWFYGFKHRVHNAFQDLKALVLLREPGVSGTMWHANGFGWSRTWEAGADYIYTTILAPYWIIALLTALLPAVWMASRLRKAPGDRRSRFGRCSKCGYDLRATPNRCPECGTEEGLEGE